MKNRTSSYIVIGIITLAIIGAIASFVSDPVNFLQRAALFVLIGATIFFLFRRFSKAGPRTHENRAFQKAAKKFNKRFHNKEGNVNQVRQKLGTISPLKKKKKDASHLTVIDGKKSKRKNRASF